MWTDHDPFQKSFWPVLKGAQTQTKGSGGLGVKFETYKNKLLSGRSIEAAM